MNGTNEGARLQLMELTQPQQTRLEQLTAIVREHQASEIDGFLVDATTANVMVKVATALNGANRQKFLGFPVDKMADVAWRLVE